jgi:hypothetical protein
MLDVAIRRPETDGTGPTVSVDLGRRAAAPLPVDPALTWLLPDGLRRGSTVAVTGSISLLLALLGTASADGAWCALVGFGHVSAEAAHEYGVELSRLAVVPEPGASWTTVVGALLDAVDVVAARPPRRIVPGDVRRLAARVRTRQAVFVPFCNSASDWPGADVRLRAEPGVWAGIGAGTGRLRARQVTVTADGRGSAARPRSAELWLPTALGGVEPVTELHTELPTITPAVTLAG